MKDIDPVLGIIASLLGSYKTQLSLIAVLDAGGLRTLCIDELRVKINRDIKTVNKLFDTLVLDIHKDTDKGFDSLTLVAEASRDTHKKSLRDIRVGLAQKCIDQEMILEAQMATVLRHLHDLEKDLEKI